MQRSMISKYLPTSSWILNPVTRPVPLNQIIPPCDIFINHRGVDTKKTIASLLYQRLMGLGFNPFLDNKSMKPGENLCEKIDEAIKTCRVGVVVFSPRYNESYYCMHELALMLECKKKVVPIFWDVQPSELRFEDNGRCSSLEVEKFQRAVEETKSIVGLTFDSSNGDWSKFLTTATDAVLRNLMETEDENCVKHKITKYNQ